MNDELAHIGVLGMRWGRRRSSNTPESRKAKRTARNVAIRVGTALTVVAAGAIYLKNKKTVDSAVKSFLSGNQKIKFKDLPRKPIKISPNNDAVFKKYGLDPKNFVRAGEVIRRGGYKMITKDGRPLDIGANPVYRPR